jgi:hypothetical protein
VVNEMIALRRDIHRGRRVTSRIIAVRPHSPGPGDGQGSYRPVPGVIR